MTCAFLYSSVRSAGLDTVFALSTRPSKGWKQNLATLLPPALAESQSSQDEAEHGSILAVGQ
jgi:hypothetical protein